MHAFALGAPSAFPFREKAAYLTRRILANRDVRRGFGERASYSLRGFDQWGVVSHQRVGNGNVNAVCVGKCCECEANTALIISSKCV